MSEVDQFQLIRLGSIALPCFLAAALFILPWPKSLIARGASSVVCAWLVAVLYTALIYNPAGIAAALAQGVHFPEARYDNNTIASTILGGWIYPAMTVTGVGLVRAVWMKIHKVFGGGRGGA